MLLSLAGKKCIITGGSRGIGLAIARRFVQESAEVTIVARQQAHLAAAVTQLRALQMSDAPKIHSRAMDASSADAWKELMAEEDRRVDVLVNCAGVAQESVLPRTRDADAEKIVGVNLLGAIHGCKYASLNMAKHSRAGDKGDRCIINVSSLLAMRAQPGTAVYAASKAGLLGLTTSLAKEFEKWGIRVNAIVPGYIKTNMTEHLETPERLKQIPAGRFGHVDEVADAAAFLAKNAYANNCILNLDGGMSA